MRQSEKRRLPFAAWWRLKARASDELLEVIRSVFEKRVTAEFARRDVGVQIA